jgi:hypothetical protein
MSYFSAIARQNLSVVRADDDIRRELGPIGSDDRSRLWVLRPSVRM